MNSTLAQTVRTAAFVALLACTSIPSAHAASDGNARDLTAAFRTAGVNIADMRVVEVGGIVVIRGRATGQLEAEKASLVAQTLGYPRVANLVQVIIAPDDAAIERNAERQLTQNRSLDGCTLSVDSDHGVIRVAGRIQYELQKDVVLSILRNLDGVTSIQTDLRREEIASAR
jgi:osmotically-inducible protein OsmY